MGSDADDDKKKVLKSAPPPWHAVAVCIGFSGLFVYTLPSLEQLDEAATMKTFTKVVYPDYLDVYTLAYIRLLIGLAIWAVTIHTVFFSKGWVQETNYIQGSKLLKRPNYFVGVKTLFPFTCVSWNLLGFAFTLSGYIALQGARGDQVSPWLLRTALVVWEIAAPNTLLVAAVIRYAIWPGVLAQGGDTTDLKGLRNKFMHNINVLYAATEFSLLGGLPVRWSEMSFAPLLGLAYVVFTWNMTMSWCKPEDGPQFIYFFFDTTLGYTHTIALVALLFVLLLFFALFCGCEEVLKWSDSGIVGSLVFIVVLCGSVMRFKD